MTEYLLNNILIKIWPVKKVLARSTIPTTTHWVVEIYKLRTLRKPKLLKRQKRVGPHNLAIRGFLEQITILTHPSQSHKGLARLCSGQL